METAALYCDETVDYRCPAEPDSGETVILRFRTGRDCADHVYYIEEGTGEKRELKRVDQEGRFDFYETAVKVKESVIRYYFEIRQGEESCFFNRLGLTEQAEFKYAYRIIPGFHVPEWAQGAVMYQIFVDRFSNGDRDNDVESDEYVYIGYPVMRIKDWEEGLSVMDVDRFYGGDLQGILDKLDYLESLKVEVIYLNPVFVSPSNHKYDCQDYEHVDPHIGVIAKDAESGLDSDAQDNEAATKYITRTTDQANLDASDALFARFVEEIHKRGMRVILDGVFNHCGSFNKWLDREKIYAKNGGYSIGAYESKHSPYRKFFNFRDQKAWPDNKTYEGWWDHSTLPKLNYEESPELCRYILNIAKKWLSPPYCVDGWRLDVAADLGHSPEFNHEFWRDFRRAVKEANPDALILAEHYGDASEWLNGDQWDTVMNYDAFMEPVSWFLTGMEKHSDAYNEEVYGNGNAFFCAMVYNMSRMQTSSVMAAMNELSNHDHSRFLTRTNHQKGRLETKGSAAASEEINYGIFREAVVIQMTWPGAPTIYYGDETGVCGWTDPDSRRTYPWGKENQELIEFHRYLTGIRKLNPAFRNGSFKPLLAEHRMIAYARFNRTESGIVLLNNDRETRTVELPAWEAGVAGDFVTRIMETTEERYNAGHLDYAVSDGMLTVEIGPHSAMIFEEKRA